MEELSEKNNFSVSLLYADGGKSGFGDTDRIPGKRRT